MSKAQRDRILARRLSGQEFFRYTDGKVRYGLLRPEMLP